MSRAELALTILCSEALDGFAPRVNDGPIFAGRYPGGFAPVGTVDEGDFLEFSPAHIALVGKDLDDEQFRRLCEAIRMYQQATIVSVGIRMPADLVVLKFIDDEPEDATVLAVMAAKLRMPLVRFVGADRGTGVHT